jgi:hypothetical protein
MSEDEREDLRRDDRIDRRDERLRRLDDLPGNKSESENE